MTKRYTTFAEVWQTIGSKYLPFADAATPELPLSRLLRLSLFQISVGMATVLLTGTLNRVMIIELSVPAWIVAVMVSLPLIVAPFRALIGFKSDTHKSFLGWRRVPYVWMGTMLQYGGFAIMPFAIMVLSPLTDAPIWLGQLATALAFLLVGAGIHVTQTAGLALATDLATPESRPRVVALLYVMLLVGMLISALMFSFILYEFSDFKLVQVLQGAAVLTVFLNIIAMWKQEARNPKLTLPSKPRPTFSEAWREFSENKKSLRVLLTVGLGTAAFTMQDILLEPFGGQILNLSVSATTALTAFWALGTLAGLAYSARQLHKGADPFRLAALGVLIGIAAFSAVIFAAPLQSHILFCCGTILIGFGGGIFAVSTLTAAMALADSGYGGLVLGAWGAVQATAAGAAIALGGIIRDTVTALAESGMLGKDLDSISIGYSAVYHIEIILLFITLASIGPLVRRTSVVLRRQSSKFGLAELPS